MLPPGLDHSLGFLERVEDLTVEQFVAQLAVEALAVAVLPGTAWFDIGGLGANSCNPCSQSQRNELRTVARGESGGYGRM
jgi:hypothetical protein